MLPFLDKKAAVADVLTKMDEKGQLKNIEEGEDRDTLDLDKHGTRLAANEVMNSLHMKDETKFLSSMKALMQLLSDGD